MVENLVDEQIKTIQGAIFFLSFCSIARALSVLSVNNYIFVLSRVFSHGVAPTLIVNVCY